MRRDEIVTLATYQTLTPRLQGYVVYMQAELVNSELKKQKNPYRIGSDEYNLWNEGQFLAVMECQDVDDG